MCYYYCVILSPLTRLSMTFFYNYFDLNYRWIYPKENNRNSMKKIRHEAKFEARVKSVFLEILAILDRMFLDRRFYSVFFRERCKEMRINLLVTWYRAIDTQNFESSNLQYACICVIHLCVAYARNITCISPSFEKGHSAHYAVIHNRCANR